MLMLSNVRWTVNSKEEYSKCEKVKQKPQIDSGDQSREYSHLVMIVESKKKTDPSLLAKSGLWTPHLQQPPWLPFTLYKRGLLPLQELACGSPWLQTLNCNTPLIPKKLLFPGEISSSLFALCQYLNTVHMC